MSTSQRDAARPDPAVTDPANYRVIFENERVRVLEYRDTPGTVTRPHFHPGSVMYTLSSFDRRLVFPDRAVEVRKTAGEVSWLDAQLHHGENIGTTDTHVLFIELKDS